MKCFLVVQDKLDRLRPLVVPKKSIGQSSPDPATADLQKLSKDTSTLLNVGQRLIYLLLSESPKSLASLFSY